MRAPKTLSSALNAKDLLEMGDGVAAVVTTNNPKLSAAASEEGTEVIGANQDPEMLCQFNHLLWRGGGIKLTPQLRITFHLMEEMIKGIQ